MSRYLPLPVLVLFFCVKSSLCFCQQQKDSLHLAPNLSLKDTARLSIDWNSPPVKKVFPYKSFLVPALMVTYGVTSLKSKTLIHFNEKIKEEVFTEGSQKKTTLDNYLVFAPAVAVYALNAAGVKGKNNFRDRTMIYGISTLISSSIFFSVKSFTGETRPDGSNNFSFPSGHTATAFAAAEFLRQEYKDVSPWYGVAGYAAAAATGYLRVYNNKHWVGDVVAGAGIGIISTRLAYYIYPTIKRKFFKHSDVSTVVMPTYQNGAVGLGLVHKF